MKELLVAATETAVVVVDAMALVIVLIGTAGAFVAAIKTLFTSLDGHERRSIWLTYARWLVAALTFQLAADILESSIAASWEAVAKLAAVAAVRTFLNYFLERDVAEVREIEKQRAAEARASNA
jgi:uncharacterized membrane protein